MEIFREQYDTIKLELPKGSVITLGNFDGIHLGHQSLIRETVSSARKKGVPAVLVTYKPHPSQVLFPDSTYFFLHSDFEKYSKIDSLGIDIVLELKFNKELSQVSAEDFLKDLLVSKLHAKKIIIGFNHHFGKDRRGDFELLQKYKDEYGFEVTNLDPIYSKEDKVSSSLIRSSILKGDLDRAKECLGEYHGVTTRIIEGAKRGNTIGFPTANHELVPGILLPPNAVYATSVEFHGKRFDAMTNLGKNPSFENDFLRMETHIFKFHENLYNEFLKVSFVKKIRDEKKFNSLESLKEQLEEDKLQSIQILSTLF